MTVSAAKKISASKKSRKPAPSPQRQPENYGYMIDLIRDDRGLAKVVSGCRRFTFAQARKHWTSRKGPPRCVDGLSSCDCKSGSFPGSSARARALKMLKLLPTLEKRAKGYGWLTATKVKRPRVTTKSR